MDSEEPVSLRVGVPSPRLLLLGQTRTTLPVAMCWRRRAVNLKGFQVGATNTFRVLGSTKENSVFSFMPPSQVITRSCCSSASE
jgi:hypothetical protein